MPKIVAKECLYKEKDVSLHPCKLNNMNTNRTSKAFIVRAAITLLVMLFTSATAWAESVKYIDADGKEKTQNEFTIINNKTQITLGTANKTTWYVMTGEINYESTVSLMGDVHIILADGAQIEINAYNGVSSDDYYNGIYAIGSLTIYGQEAGTGTLTINSDKITKPGNGIFAENGGITINGGILSITADWYGITTANNDITINGGKITVTSTGENGIDATGNITITGGNVTATGENRTDPGKNGINATGNITITGGNVIANGENYGIFAQSTVNLSGGNVIANGENYGIFAQGTVNLSGGIVTTNNIGNISLSGAIVTASSYSGTVTVQSGVTYTQKDLTTNYTENIDVSSLNGITLLPTTCFGIASGNDGSQGKPYTITSPEELQLLAIVVNEENTFSSKYIQVCNNIDMYGINFSPIGYKTGTKFCGNFDGGGYIISNLYININIDATCIGLFGFVNANNATVQNITISNATINGDEYVGGIVGSLDNGSIKNCCVINSKITSTASPYNYCGAIAGNRGNSTILANNYYSGCTVAGKNSGVGCGGSSSPSDISANDGAVSATFLSESENVPSSLSGKIVFRRVFTGGSASTICLPFDYTPNGSEETFYTFTGITKKGEGSSATYEATMTKVTSTSLSANKPYLFVPAGNNTLKPVLFHGTANYDASNLTDTKTPWTFIGTYSRLTYVTSGTGLFSDPVYGFAAKAMGDVIAGEFVRADVGAYIPPMRCFLKYGLQSGTRGETDELPERITVKLVNDPTSIGTLNTRTGEVTFDDWYSLDGHRLNSKPTKKGLYIYKGIKVTIK